MAQGHVVDVDEDFVLALTIPYLATGVSRIEDDRANGTLSPRHPGTMTVSCRVVRGRARESIGRQPFGDCIEAATIQVLTEDPCDYRRGYFVEFQAMQALAVRRLGGIRMRPGVDKAVAVRWTPTQEPAFHLSLCGHGGASQAASTGSTPVTRCT